MKTIMNDDCEIEAKVGVVIEDIDWFVIVEVDTFRDRDGNLEFFVVGQDKDGEEYDISDDFYWK